MTKYVLITLLLAATIVGFNCKKNPVEPPVKDGTDSTGTDTTSHNWTFTIDTLGDGNGSTLYDAAIVSIDPPLIYAVGEIYLKDSTGQFNLQPYSVLEWDGHQWKLNRIYNTDNNLIPNISGIFIFTSSDIWLADGGVYRWDGTSRKVSESFDRISLIGGTENGQSVNKLWGTSSNNLYGIGWKGMVTKYNGSSWQKLSSGINTDIQDIWGYQNNSGKISILAVGSTVYYGGDESLLSISGSNVTQLNTNGLSWSIRGVWFDSHSYYVSGAEIYYKKTLQDSLWQIIRPAPSNSYGYVSAIRGNAWNDIIAVGAFGTFLHYNGNSWYNFTQHLNLSGCDFYSVSIKDNLVVAVGTLGGDRAIAVVGVRK